MEDDVIAHKQGAAVGQFSLRSKIYEEFCTMCLLLLALHETIKFRKKYETNKSKSRKLSKYN